MSVEIAALGIFDSLDVNEIKELVKKIIENSPIETEFNFLKTNVIQQAITMNQQKRENKAPKIQRVELMPLIELRTKALDKKQHPYILLKESGYIKNPLQEFYK